MSHCHVIIILPFRLFIPPKHPQPLNPALLVEVQGYRLAFLMAGLASPISHHLSKSVWLQPQHSLVAYRHSLEFNELVEPVEVHC